MAQAQFDIVRFKNDTYPIKGTIEINNNYVDLTDASIVMYYDEVVGGVVRNVKIRAVITEPQKGEFKVIPKKVYTEDITDPQNPIEMYPFTVEGTFDYSIIRLTGSYEFDGSGLYVFSGGEYITYDPLVHTGVQRLSKFTDTMTHRVGKLYINDRVGA